MAAVSIVGAVQRTLVRKLIALLVLLTLVAGGGRFAAMAMTMDERGAAHMADMQTPDTDCKSCGGVMAAAPCDAVCTALPAIEAAIIGLSDMGFHERWLARSDAGATCSVRPDTSPPRA
jgi:hypothetical protein